MRCSDGHFYVVKFRNNPQHRRVLANEMLASCLARLAGLPVPEGEVVEVRQWLIEHRPELRIELGHNSIRCEAGLQFGSRHVVDPICNDLGRPRNRRTALASHITNHARIPSDPLRFIRTPRSEEFDLPVIHNQPHLYFLQFAGCFVGPEPLRMSFEGCVVVRGSIGIRL